MKPSQLLEQIDLLKQESAEVTPKDTSYLKKFWDKFRLEFNYNSNHIEGNTLTYGHTHLLLFFDKLGADTYSLRELEEMKAHDAALRLVQEMALEEEDRMSEKFIKEINRLILVRPFYKEAVTSSGQPTRREIIPGQYKSQPNSVRLENGEIFEYISPTETPSKMGDLLEWYRTEQQKKELHPIEIAALFHYKFVIIHPFDDSNGRTSRLLMNYVLLRYGYAPIVVESKDKKNYLAALNRADTGDLNTFLEYIKGLCIKWQSLYLNALKGENIEEADDIDKEIELLKQEKIRNVKIGSRFSINSFHTVFSGTILPLFKLLIEKARKIDDFFYEKEIYLQIIRTEYPIKEANEIEKIIQANASVFENIGIGIALIYSHKGLKTKNDTVFSHRLVIKVSFQEFQYHILGGHDETLCSPKLYADGLSESEQNTIVQNLIKKEILQIKELS